ncbi:MAG: hypothetical protein V3R72_09815, partial [Gammaproteobacteria bacterium]
EAVTVSTPIWTPKAPAMAPESAAPATTGGMTLPPPGGARHDAARIHQLDHRADCLLFDLLLEHLGARETRTIRRKIDVQTASGNCHGYALPSS